MAKMFNLLKEEEAIAYEKGLSKNVREKKLKLILEIPKQPKEYKADHIKKLRKKLNCSQC